MAESTGASGASAGGEAGYSASVSGGADAGDVSAATAATAAAATTAVAAAGAGTTDAAAGAASAGSGAPAGAVAPTMVGQMPAKTEDGRHKFVHSGRTIYEWEQSLEEVNIYIKPPEGVKAKHLSCKVTPRHITLGIKGNPPFIDEDLAGLAIADESYWMMEDGELHINIQKARKAETWPSALAGHAALDPYSQTEVQKKMMLERFQEENPGFDFSGAEFSGNVPDPRTFMEGVKYK